MKKGPHPKAGFLSQDLFIGLGIFAVAFILYGNTIPNGYNIDDPYVTQNNPKVQKGLAGIPEIFVSRYVDEEGNSFGYRPIAMATYAVEYQLWKQNPHVSHFVNVLIYALCLLVLFKVLRKIFRNTHLSFILAILLVFAAHPIHTEVVASLKNRETLLSFLLSLTALLYFLKWMDTRRFGHVIAGVLSFILAFLSKQDAITFAAVIPLALYYHSSEPVPFKTDIPAWIRKVQLSDYIFMIPATVCFFIFFYATRRLTVTVSAITYFAALAFMVIHFFSTKGLQRKIYFRQWISIFLAGGILLFTAAAIFANLTLALLSLISFGVFFSGIFRPDRFKTIFSSRIIITVVLSLLLLGIAGIVFYKVPDMYLPAENKIVYHFENPQFGNNPGYSTWPLAMYTLYFYMVKLFLPHPLGFYYGYKMIPEVSWTSPEVIFSLVFNLGLLTFALWRLPKKHILSFAILYYLATISIFTNSVIKIPGIVGERMAFFPSLGFCIAIPYLLFRLLRIDLAAIRLPRQRSLGLSMVLLLVFVVYSIKTISRNTQWKDYLTLFSHDIKYLANSAKANKVYASQLISEAFRNDMKNPAPQVQQEYLKLAVQHLKKTVEIDPTYQFAWNNLGLISYQYLGNKKEGLDCMRKALAIDPDYREAHFNLGFAYKLQKDYEQSIYHFREAQRINPAEPSYFTAEADVWMQLGQPDTALILCEKASVLDPTSDLPLIQMGNIYWVSGDTVRAIGSWERAFEKNPANLEVCTNLLGYYQRMGSARADFYGRKVRELQLRKH